jgi:8-oxo-dGTP pyrophosphatase MutT (NUDIX family)
LHAARIRPIAICVCHQNDRILVAEYCENGRFYYRPLGGRIEFGERGVETVQREFIEEIGVGLVEVRYLGMLENIFTSEGRRAHQIVLVYDGQLSDRSLYEKESLPGDELGSPFTAVWKRLSDFSPETMPLYPEGLREMLSAG